MDLLSIVKMTPPNIFMEIMSKKELFKEIALKSGKSNDMIILLIVILGKIHKIPLRCYLRDLMEMIFGSSDNLRDDILAYLRYSVDLEERNEENSLPYGSRVWDSLESFCSFGKKIDDKVNYYADFTRSVCGILEGCKRESLKMTLSKFSNLMNEMENAWFYPGSIYSSVEDLKESPTLEIPTIQNGRFPDAREYLTYQISHLRHYFLNDLSAGVNECQEMEDKNVLVKSIGSGNIFPCVQIHRNFPPFVRLSFKHFLLDLAPHKRVDLRLPEEIKAELINPDFLVPPGSLLFFSSTSAYEDLIVAEVMFMPNEDPAEGYLLVKIHQVEQIRENFLGKDLFLITIPFLYSSKTFTLNTLKKISTATLPMRKYLVDCEPSESLPDYEMVENDLSLEKINLRAESYESEDLTTIGMGEGQFQAFRSALTQTVTLIEGPPGVGKTSIALGIVKRLLTNTSFRILIISHGNYLLDQFLLQCSAFTDKIARIGWQFGIPDVEKFALNSNFKDIRYYRMRDDAAHQSTKAMKKFMRSGNISEDLQGLREANLRQDEFYQMNMYFNCRHARIIGITSTGTAKYHELVEILRPAVVIADRSTQMAEWHLITALTEHAKQLILFGDASIQQDHECSLGLGNDCSKATLTGRLIANNCNTIHLNVQYRMQPEISNLIRATLFPNLIDGENVKQFQSVRGVSRNLFCVSHKSPETLPPDTLDLLKSEHNIESVGDEMPHETLFCVCFANYLRQQGYEALEVAILATNASQQEAIIKIADHFPLLKDVMVYRVAACCGNECRIIILSILERIDDEDFDLLIQQRHITTLLTRAKEGLYILGQLDRLAEESEIWRYVRTYLTETNAIGTGLPTKCEEHGSEMIMSGVEDFLEFTRKGCSVGEELPKTDVHPCLSYD